MIQEFVSMNVPCDIGEQKCDLQHPGYMKNEIPPDEKMKIELIWTQNWKSVSWSQENLHEIFLSVTWKKYFAHIWGIQAEAKERMIQTGGSEKMSYPVVV